MQLIVPREVVSQMVEALARAGHREIGGIIMGEHVGIDTFRVRELTIQRHGGTFASFVRFVEGFLTPLRMFFEKTKHDYTKFNYLGEWHSHHSFALSPSGPDNMTMHDIVSDRNLGANFVVLLLVKLSDGGRLQSSITIYQPHKPPFRGEVLHEND